MLRKRSTFFEIKHARKPASKGKNNKGKKYYIAKKDIHNEAYQIKM